MPYRVRYSTRAYGEYERIIDYVVENFGLEVAARVDRHFEEIIDQISINPYLYPFSDTNKNLRRCVISPQTTLYYRFTGEVIELASFRGNRMNPKAMGL